jgi:hypothetical protein
VRVSREDRPNGWHHARVLAGYEIRELRYPAAVLPLLLQMLGSSPEVFRVCVAVLVVHLTPAFGIDLPVQRNVPRAAQRIFHAGRLHGSESVPKAQVDVVQEPTQVRTVVPGRIEGLNDVSFTSFAVLGRGRQVRLHRRRGTE